MSKTEPKDAPPSYATATGSSTQSNRLSVPRIPADRRRSMEDENRPLPPGWLRQFDPAQNHQFFVNTNVDPATSIWQHPLDDEQFLKSLSAEERERLQQVDNDWRFNDHSDYEDEKGASQKTSNTGKESFPSELPSRPGQSDRQGSKADLSHDASGKKLPFGERIKNKVTGSTKAERDEKRAERDEEERQYYIAHQKFRAAMAQAAQTGQPQFFAKDRDGKEIWIEPPGMSQMGGYGSNAYGYSPYRQGPYSNVDPSSGRRYIRPNYAYNRPMGAGYGYGGGMYGRPGYGYGGMGMPIAGGLLGGMLLGGLLF